MKFDYAITDAQERIKYIQNILNQQDYWPSRDLGLMADYILRGSDDSILTPNRLVTINRRETSFQALSERLEGGEDALHSLIRQDKQMILSPKNSITPEDIQQIPELAELRHRIAEWENFIDVAPPKTRYKIKRMLIEMRKEQYSIKQLYKMPMYTRTTNQITLSTCTSDELRLDQPEHISEILNNYIRLKQELDSDLHNDLRWTLIDLHNLIELYLKNEHPVYYDILLMKTRGDTNEEIQLALTKKWGKRHSQEYISSLWRNRIPQTIADAYREQYLNWFYTFKSKGLYKTCSRCMQPKLAHKRYFGTNAAAKYGFYSVCKQCRNKR